MTDLTLREAIDDYLLTMQCEGYSPRTVTLYGQGLRQLANFMATQGRHLLAELTPSVVRAAQGAALQPKTNPAASNWLGGHGMANVLGSAAKAMARRYRRDGIDCPDLTPVRNIKQPQRIQPRLTGPEFALLEQAIGRRVLRKNTPRFLIARDHAIVLLLVETGLRAAELCALDLADIDFVEGSVLVRHGKNGKDRALNIADPDPAETDGGATLRALADWLTHRERLYPNLRDQALWLTPKGNRLNPHGLRLVLSKLCEEAGINGNRPPHAFRRGWFTTSYLADPNSLPVLSARMGWSNMAMARVYTRGATIDLARTRARPSISKMWRDEADAREAKPRPKPAVVQRREDLQALVGLIQSDATLKRALLQALQDGVGRVSA